MRRSYILFILPVLLLGLLLAAGCGSKEPVTVDMDAAKGPYGKNLVLQTDLPA